MTVSPSSIGKWFVSDSLLPAGERVYFDDRQAYTPRGCVLWRDFLHLSTLCYNLTTAKEISD
jgi:hypothetical protein